ncbi:zinc finger protein 528-like [Culicoides brevitarsis]|uniref:zinc finger protein 528-like n=1 Tax=Culicoides brevitarsis TaxID=469753 RepID=UPI00307B6772
MFNAENTDQTCQCCLKSDENLRLIHSSIEFDRQETKIADLFRCFTDDYQIFREFHVGSMICNDCLQQLLNTQSFYQMCVQSTKVIQIKQDLDLEPEQMQDQVLEAYEPVLIRIPTPPLVVIDDDDEEVVRTRKSPIKFPENREISTPDAKKVQKIRVIVPYRFECFKCSSTHKTQTDFLVHLAEVHEALCILCDTCGAVFNNQVANNSHQLKHFIEMNTRFPCGECAQQFPSPQALKMHSFVHSSEILCQLCTKPFHDYATLNNHLQQHANQRALQCIYCDLVFHSAFCLNDHISEVHNARRVRCSMCPERFVSKDLMRQHFAETHETPRETYDCKVCKKVFDDKSALTNHLQTHLSNGNKFIPVHTTTPSVVRTNNNNNHQRYHATRNVKNQQNNNNYPQNGYNNQRNANNFHGNQRQHQQQTQGKAKKPVKRLNNNVYSRLG